MITAEQAQDISSKGLSFLEKKIEYEILTIDSLIRYKVYSQESFLLYTIYKGKLSESDYKIFKHRLIKELDKNGYKLGRRGKVEEEPEFLTIKIVWG